MKQAALVAALVLVATWFLNPGMFLPILLLAGFYLLFMWMLPSRD